MLTGDASGKLFEERRHDFNKLSRLDHVQDLLEFVQKHHLLRAVHLWPVLQQVKYHLCGVVKVSYKHESITLHVYHSDKPEYNLT